MTNGEKLQTILNVDRDCTEVHGENGTMTFTVTQDFWNAEYKEPTTKNDKVDCKHTDCNNCVNHKYCDYEPTTKNDLGVDYRSLEDIKKLVERKADDLDGVMLDASGVIIGLYFAIANDLPSVTPQEPKKGHWIIEKTVFDKYGNTVECSSCHKKWKTYDEVRWRKVNKYCPNCGSDNREVVEE